MILKMISVLRHNCLSLRTIIRLRSKGPRRWLCEVVLKP
ncbi:hypothetical protein MANES_06G017733v8 [Manihot esculenta]|uniref:Uncharacterized protein n=1 Tax=Manihot esculenta TaxID=3983 RepID=A0ACB7HGK7_MANES|nr:hypothetical protein MANES_06G017733v8 [Manihot esculenta]